MRRDLVAPVLAALSPILLLAPSAARGDPSAARGAGVLQLSGGVGQVGAPNLVLGGGVGVFDTGTTRLDLLARLGVMRVVDASGAASDGTPYTGEIGGQELMLGGALSRRLGRSELFAGVGWARARTSWEHEVACTWVDETFNPDSCTNGMKSIWDDGSRVNALTGSAGVRWTLGSSFLLELEARYQMEGRSRIADGLSRTLGGFSFSFGAVYRTGFLSAWSGSLQPALSGTPPPVTPVEAPPQGPPPPGT